MLVYPKTSTIDFFLFFTTDFQLLQHFWNWFPVFQKNYLDSEGHGKGRRERIIKSTLLQKKHSYVIPTQMFVDFPGLKTVMSFYTVGWQSYNDTKFLNHWQLKEIKNITQKSLPRIAHLWKKSVCPSGVIYILNISKTEVTFPCTTGKVFFSLRTLSNESHVFKWLCIKTQDGRVIFY